MAIKTGDSRGDGKYLTTVFRSDSRIQKPKTQDKRKGNNVFGSKGKKKCGACRKARRTVMPHKLPLPICSACTPIPKKSASHVLKRALPVKPSGAGEALKAL